MYYVLVLSLSSPKAAIAMNTYLIPDGLHFDSYRVIMKDMTMWRAYGNTLLYVSITTVLMLVTCVLAAYPLTSSRLAGKKWLTVYLLIPMYFGGGLIPTYLVMSKLHLYNNIWAIILPGCFSIWNIILTRTYCISIPESLREAAKIDGASHFQIMTRIYLPLPSLLSQLSIFIPLWYLEQLVQRHGVSAKSGSTAFAAVPEKSAGSADGRLDQASHGGG